MGNVSGSLEDRLYDAVVTQLDQKHQQHAPAITGMLLELGKTKVETLLDSEDLLNVAVEKSLKSCKISNNLGITHEKSTELDKNKIGESLYKKVEELCPDRAAKITGMLLELGERELHTLLDSETVLTSAVRKAEQVCTGYERDDSINTGDQLYRSHGGGDQTLGDQLYEKVEGIYPDHAAKITGMLLEQPESEILKLLQDEDVLLQCIHKSLTVLQAASS